ncbi:MAG: glutamate 5-kinase [Candidatus Burarchaeum sp.]|nr:glutamate 5-kinase [Candidatus Burarchaeum sp.]MDO8339247.1 glutamate 5-kinase [Candidatus Burarchaeum sp.]
MHADTLKFSPEKFKRIAVKAGTNVLASADGTLDREAMARLVDEMAGLWKQGRDIIFVTSGAIGSGMALLGLKQRPRETVMQQACAAVGQGALMHAYEELFSKHGIRIAQVLLTNDDFTNKARYLNLMTAIDALLKVRAIPIINENDVVSTAELEHSGNGGKQAVFGDNDGLSALVAGKMHADLLILLTDVDGLYDANPKKDKGARIIRRVERITPELEAAAGDGGSLGRGGMRSKLAAAKLATCAGVWVAIANGKKEGVIEGVLEQREGTLFSPSACGLSGKEQWIAFASQSKGTVEINERARDALLKNGASLLAVGVVGVKGEFEKGEVVEIRCGAALVGRGKCNYSAKQLLSIAGKKKAEIAALLGKAEEVVDRENLVFNGND